jgi:parallel beta-helix repeat protein
MKTPAVLLVIVFLMGLIVLLPVKADSRIVIVPDDYGSIQEAINHASDGDTVFIKKGVYVENPIVNKSISLVGEDRDSTVIDVTAGLKVQSNYVNITGLTIYDGHHGITVSANSSRIFGNKITDARVGIALLSAYNNVVAENILENIGLSAAIRLSYSNNNIIQYNYIDSCTEGIQLREGSSNNTVIDNIVSNCQDVAIRLLGSGLGKKWYGPDGNTIMRNNISYSRVGTTVYGANNNVVSNNNYVNNTIQFSASEDYYLIWGGTRSVNTIDRNYWSDYEGKDLNKDGIGDSPYVIDEYNQDKHPLMNPVQILPPPFQSTRPKPPPTTLLIASVVTVLAVVGLGLLVYHKKRRRGYTNINAKSESKLRFLLCNAGYSENVAEKILAWYTFPGKSKPAQPKS